ncbi:MAG: glycosyltransferase family A protein [Pseudomonadota bacterium]|nr:glycosyltransferase family A protein [Pseudomonadota bacterium]
MSSVTSGAGTGLAVSVVVPTFGRLDLLDCSLDALTRQDLPAGTYEIIIVDGRPERNTLQLVAGWRARTLDRGPRLVYLANDGAEGAAAARNRGWRSATGAIIAFTDDDTVPATDWLRHGLAGFADDTDVLYGSVDTPHRVGATDDAGEAEETAFEAANCFFRRDVLNALGGFDERFGGGWREASDLHFRLLEMHAAIVRAPQALVVHPQRPVWGASLRGMRKVSLDALLYKKHPALYRQKIRRLPCWEDYAVVAALLAAVAGLAGGYEILAVTGCGAWLVLTAMSCIRRLHGRAQGAAHVADVLITSALMPPVAVFWRMVGAIKYRVRFG